MHELGITQEIVKVVCNRAGEAKITRIVLEIGKLTAVMPNSVRFCFDLCVEGTQAQGAVLEIIEPPGIGRCRACSAEVAVDHPYGQCACGCSELEWISGDELKVKEMEIEYV